MRSAILFGLALAATPLIQDASAPEPVVNVGSVSGRVFDSNGKPMDNSVVGILRIVYTRGRRSVAVVDTRSSDARGGYRFYPVPPGEYYVGAAPSNDTQVTTLHPNTRNLNSASKVMVHAAEEVTGIDIQTVRTPRE